ncbi:MAG: MFS transporter [Myxococcota bacterium]
MALAPPTATAPDPNERPPEFSRAYTRYALGLLLLVYVVNFLDRQVVAILLQAIKEDLQLSDTQLGAFSGIAFALLYSTLGIPIAQWADRGVRRSIISLAMLTWSGMTALQGLATGFWTLVAARVGVGVGEAGCSPPAHSIIADLFAPTRRATALSIYALGIPIGGAIGLAGGGWLRETFDWRIALMIVGVPGIVLAVLVRLTLREPTRGYWEGGRTEAAPPPPLAEVARVLRMRRSFVHMALAGALHAFYGYGAAAFNPAFLERVHELGALEIGLWLGVIAATAGAAGTFLGGWLTDRLSTRDARWYAWLPAWGTIAGVPLVCLFYLWQDGREALALAALPALVGGLYLGPTFAMTQALVPPRMRAQAAAILLLVMNLIGLGLGPQFVGMLSDWLAPSTGVESIRWALLWTIVVGALWSAVHYFRAARTLTEDLRAAG